MLKSFDKYVCQNSYKLQLSKLQVLGIELITCKPVTCNRVKELNGSVFYTYRLIPSPEYIIFTRRKRVYYLLINIYSSKWKKSKSTWKRTRSVS